TDWADSREFTLGDIGVGECAGEVVTLTDFGVAKAESVYFDATLLLEDTDDENRGQAAADKALEAMVAAARGLLKVQNIDISMDPEQIVSDFRRYFYDTKLFFDPFAKGKFASYLFNAYEQRDRAATVDHAKQLIEEARLFIEAAHECNTRMLQLGITSPSGFNNWLMTEQMQPIA
ncbi:MAG: nitrite/sulfite reductase, partial [Cyanobacteria bacterium P01_H01_bin.121]